MTFCPKAALELALTVAKPEVTWHVQDAPHGGMLLVFCFDVAGQSLRDPVPVRMTDEIEQDDILAAAVTIVGTMQP